MRREKRDATLFSKARETTRYRVVYRVLVNIILDDNQFEDFHLRKCCKWKWKCQVGQEAEVILF